MNNNFYTIPESWYKEFNQTFNTTDKLVNANTDLANLKEGFLKGNLFNNLYEPYKNYQYGVLKANNEKDELLYNILMYQFALNDLNLYLDNYPNNSKLINLYKQYLNEKNKLSQKYEMKYGPLTLNEEYLMDNYWNWIKSPWPWEGNN